MTALRPLVFIASPYSAPTGAGIMQNLHYLMHCCRDALSKGENPYAPHWLFPQFLQDQDPAERKLGITLGCEVMLRCAYICSYADRGVTAGMSQELQFAQEHNIPILTRFIYPSPITAPETT